MNMEVIVRNILNVVKANNPKVGDKVFSFSGSSDEGIEHILTEKINGDIFKSNKFSAIHVDNIYFIL